MKFSLDGKVEFKKFFEILPTNVGKGQNESCQTFCPF